MSFLEEKYKVTSHSGNVYSFTARQLCEWVIKDSESDYNWVAPARELVRICRQPTFPMEYAITIKIAILNCFTNIEARENRSGDRYIKNPEDEEAVQYCYNSLYGVDTEEANSARSRFLDEKIKTASYVRVFDPLYHSGPTFVEIKVAWSKYKFDEYISQENIDFKKMLEILRSSFASTIKMAEVHGDFEEDDKKDSEDLKKLAQRLKDIM